MFSDSRNAKGIVGRAVLLVLLTLCPGFSQLASGQPNARIYIPVSVDMGLHFAKVQKDSISSWSQNPGSAVHLKTGLNVMLRERVGLSTEGGLLLVNYNFKSPLAEYSVTNYTFTIQTSPYFLFPIRAGEPLKLHVGSAFGWIYHNEDELSKSEDSFEVNTKTFGPRTFYFAPELGISRIEKRSTVSILLTYQYQDRSNPSTQSIISDANGTFDARGKGDYFGVRIRLSLELGGAPKVKKLYLPNPPVDILFRERESIVVQKLSTRQRYISLALMDSGEIDNDSISVAVNGKYVLTHERLTRKKIKLRVPLDEGINQITVYAHNEGDVPPNTAKCYVRKWFSKREFPISTGMKKNAVIEVEVI